MIVRDNKVNIMKPVKVNYTKSTNDARTSTTINGEIAEFYFRTLVGFNSTELRAACDTKEKYRFAIEVKCQEFVNSQKWHDKGQIERFLIDAIVQLKINQTSLEAAPF